jgi:hypothetical protein
MTKEVPEDRPMDLYIVYPLIISAFGGGKIGTSFYLRREPTYGFVVAGSLI